MTRPGEHFYRAVGGWLRSGEIGGILTEVTPWLPFDRPYRDALAAAVTDSPVFAHYYSPTPVSVNNQDVATDTNAYERIWWLPPGNRDGGLEAGTKNHRPYGGLTRDFYDRGPGRRPARPFTSSVGNEIRRQDARLEIEDAADGLLDGFTVDLLDPQTANNLNSQVVNRMFQAASEVTDFALVPMPDGGGAATASPAACIAELDFLTDYSSCWKLGGERVVAPYRPENVAVDAAGVTSFWATVKNAMAADGKPVKLWPCFEGTWTSAKMAPAFSGIAYGIGRWGVRDYGSADNADRRGEAQRAYAEFGGKPWMHYVSPQDARPKTGNVWESWNTTAFRNHWTALMNATRRAAFVQVPTWNDQSECTGVCPAGSAGYLWLDLLAYYITWWKTRIQPPIARDTLYLTHRIHHTSVDTFTSGQTGRQAFNSPVTSPAKNQVEALVFLTEPGDVYITVAGATSGPFTAPAGISAHYAELPVGVSGAVSAEVKRGGVTVPHTLAESPHLITANPVSQDLQYKGVTSRDSLRELA